jgi:hypothetical protein
MFFGSVRKSWWWRQRTEQLKNQDADETFYFGIDSHHLVVDIGFYLIT